MKIFEQTLDLSIIETIWTEVASAVSRNVLARKICEILGWRGANGKAKEMKARQLLSEPEKEGEVVLPASQGAFPEWKAL